MTHPQSHFHVRSFVFFGGSRNMDKKSPWKLFPAMILNDSYLFFQAGPV